MPLSRPSSRRRYRQYLAFPDTVDGQARDDRDHHSIGALLRAFAAFLPGLRHLLVGALACVAIASGLRLVPPAATGFVFDHVLGDQPLPEPASALATVSASDLLLLVALVLVLVALLHVGIGTTGRYCAEIASKRLQARLRRRAFDHAIRLPLHEVHRFKSGGMTSLLRDDVGKAASLLLSLVYHPFGAFVQLIGTFVVLAFVDPRLLLGPLILAPMLFVLHRVWIGRLHGLWRGVFASRQQMDGEATEAFGGIRVVRSFGREASEAMRFVTTHHLMIRQELRVWSRALMVDVCWALLIPLCLAAALFYGGLRILGDRAEVAAGLMAGPDALTTGDLVAFLFYLALLLEPMAVLSRSLTESQYALASLGRVQDLLRLPRGTPAVRGGIVLAPHAVQGRLALRDVHFRYPGSAEPVLDGVSLDIEPQQVVALVGRSGAGKTTLCNLIARFYEPTSGTIRLDGIDLRDLDAGSLHKLIAIVEQEVFLFDGTIEENIAYGRREATRADIERAAAAAQASEFIDRLDVGFETTIGERGVRLSGGQRQRLAIARALLADPRILILDEATSDLDMENERLVKLSLRTLMTGRTVIVIAHRLGTIADADRIVLLDQGRVVETGTPAELKAASRAFIDLMQVHPEDHEPQQHPQRAARVTREIGRA
jgi:ATP-binding cassette subfamily B protein